MGLVVGLGWAWALGSLGFRALSRALYSKPLLRLSLSLYIGDTASIDERSAAEHESDGASE